MIRPVMDDLFTRELLDAHPDEWGIAGYCDQPAAADCYRRNPAEHMMPIGTCG